MERETRIRQQENTVGPQQQQQQQQTEFTMRRHVAPPASPMNTSSVNELNPNTADPFLSATAAAVQHPCNAASNGAGTIAALSGAAPSSLATDFHARQESADSGLGMGGSYSLPHTPEDFLASMDDTMDTTLDCNFYLFKII